MNERDRGLTHEITVGDGRQSITLKFERDGLWVAGQFEGNEIPHKMIPWTEFESARKQAEMKHRASLYETFKHDRAWNSAWPDMKSFMDAVHHYFPRETYTLEGKVAQRWPYEDPQDHLVLTIREQVIYDFGPLEGEYDVAYSIAFRRFEELVDDIRARAEKVKGAPACRACRKWGLWKLFGRR